VSREQLARLVIEERMGLQAAAARFSVSPKTAAKWVALSAVGAAGLADRSSRPHHSPRQINSFLVEKVFALRRGHMPGYEIARRTGLSPASISRILRRAKLSPRRDLNSPPPVRIPEKTDSVSRFVGPQNAHIQARNTTFRNACQPP